VPSFSVLSDVMDTKEPGVEVTVTVQRDGEAVDLAVTTTADGDTALLGVFIDPEFDLPVDVDIEIQNVGGPSAGTMFALGIIDLLTEEDEVGGKTIAGTGTVDLTGTVGPIGGIRQKMVGATKAGATWFLAPAENCDEVVGHVPDGLDVVAIETLGGAREAVEAIGDGTTEDLPTC
jgi:PDZ domain-containing protein